MTRPERFNRPELEGIARKMNLFVPDGMSDIRLDSRIRFEQAAHMFAKKLLGIKEEPIKMAIKSFEVKIKTTIIFSTFDYADDYDVEISIRHLVEDLFKDGGIKIKQDKGIVDLEVLGFKKEKP